MLTWLDFVAHQALSSLNVRDRTTDPRTALALTVGNITKAVQDGRFEFPNGILDEIFIPFWFHS